MMGKDKGLLTRVGDAAEAAKDKAQEVSASFVKRAESAASDAKRKAGAAATKAARRAPRKPARKTAK
ncbi:MAG TPA: hypothetical protein VF014_09520, partial [Casimicrobiaceae bacterium]|nr:hypothetical protein [Casimicrobiaceae bacterium]